LYAAQSYDAAMLLNSALLKTGGKIDREPLRAALKQADFRSVAGPFRFNNNQFPIRNFYRVDVGRDNSGQAAFVTRATVLKDHPDPHASQCPMK
jgi:branched-chain amino acid transport system substrate-binding protein